MGVIFYSADICVVARRGRKLSHKRRDAAAIDQATALSQLMLTWDQER